MDVGPRVGLGFSAELCIGKRRRLPWPSSKNASRSSIHIRYPGLFVKSKKVMGAPPIYNAYKQGLCQATRQSKSRPSTAPYSTSLLDMRNVQHTLAGLPPLLTRWIGYRARPPPKQPPYIIWIWSFIASFGAVAAVQAIYDNDHLFIRRGVPSIVASFVRAYSTHRSLWLSMMLIFCYRPPVRYSSLVLSKRRLHNPADWLGVTSSDQL